MSSACLGHVLLETPMTNIPLNILSVGTDPIVLPPFAPAGVFGGLDCGSLAPQQKKGALPNPMPLAMRRGKTKGGKLVLVGRGRGCGLWGVHCLNADIPK